MSSRLAFLVLFTAALIGASIPSLAVGKPPELPLNRPIVCAPESAHDMVDAMVFGFGINSEAGLSGSIVLTSSPRSDPGASELLVKWWLELAARFGNLQPASSP